MLAVFVGCRALPAASSGDPLRRPTRSLRSGTFARRNHYLGGSAKLRGVVPRTRERRRNAEQRDSADRRKNKRRVGLGEKRHPFMVEITVAVSLQQRLRDVQIKGAIEIWIADESDTDEVRKQPPNRCEQKNADEIRWQRAACEGHNVQKWWCCVRSA